MIEMILSKGEIQGHNADLLEETLAIVLATLLYSNNTVEFVSSNDKQLKKLGLITNDLICNLTPYYYAHGDNYVESPFYSKTCEAPMSKEINYLQNNLKEADMLKTCSIDDVLYKIDKNILSNSTVKTTITIKDKDKLTQAIDEYISNYEYNILENEYGNILSIEDYDKQLYGLLTENNYNTSRFHVTDLKHIKPILYHYMQNNIAIYRIGIDIDDDTIIFNCVIDGDTFIEKHSIPKAQKPSQANSNEQSKERTHFSNNILKLYNYVKKYAKAKGYIMPMEDFIGDKLYEGKLYENEGALTSAVNRLNKQYQEISKSKDKIMEYDKTIMAYLITDIWSNRSL